MTTRRSLRHATSLLPALAALGVALAGCEQAPLQPPAAEPLSTPEATAAMGGAHSETVALEPAREGVMGTSTLQRRENGFSFRLSASGLMPGHPVTLWAIDPESGAVGRAAGGIVGGAGTVRLSGNQCVHPGGKSPGTPPVCDLIDPSGDIAFALLEGEDAWTPGDQTSRRMPAGKPLAAMAHHLAVY
jgi:hypothetical protein